ncbi:MAG: ABC transporter ATP-binding protein [Erysipelotrichaceae bacterium]|nr:ABC transporter ATP-binding protein [Erysipelotrichaceae bacterium]
MIVLEHVYQVYPMKDGPVHALQDVNVTIEKGDFVVIQGQSGSGKTTLLHILGLLKNPSEGTVRYEGQDCKGWDETTCAKYRNQTIGFVMQQDALIPYLTLEENIRVPQMIAGKIKEESIGKLLRFTQIEKQKNHLPNECSGGQRQRAVLARALVNTPQILLCDEPTASLDSANANRMVQLLRGLHRIGITIVLVTHDKRYAKAGNRLWYVHHGRVTECDIGSDIP